jgi:hypothetical protein
MGLHQGSKARSFSRSSFRMTNLVCHSERSEESCLYWFVILSAAKGLALPVILSEAKNLALRL